MERVGILVSERSLAPSGNWLLPAAHAPHDVAGILAFAAGGACIFHRRAGGSHGCDIHHALGHDALPLACQHFPRECLIDARGVFVTLSHYCPTAANLLFDHVGPVEIVAGPSAIPNGIPEGLDARHALPPLLTPALLMDPAGYTAWEEHLVGVLAGGHARLAAWRPEQSLAVLRDHARTLSAWRPGTGSLSDAVRALDVDTSHPRIDWEPDWPAERRLFDTARASLPLSHGWPTYPADAAPAWRTAVASPWCDHAAVIHRFLAAHGFASWMAYQGNGLLSLVRRLFLTLAVLRAESIRACVAEGGPLTATRLKHAISRTDLLLVHLADRGELARRLFTPPRTRRAAALHPTTQPPVAGDLHRPGLKLAMSATGRRNCRA